MKTMKLKRLLTSVIIMMCCLSMSVSLNAQTRTKKTPEERAKIMTDKMKERLQLTEKQYQSVYDINLAYAQKNQKLIDESQKDQQVRMDEFKSSQKEKNEDLKKILSDDQYTKYTQQQEDMQNKAKQKAQDRKNNK